MSQTFTGAADWSTEFLHSTPQSSAASIFADVISTDPNPNSSNFTFNSQPPGLTNPVTNRKNRVTKPARKRSRASRRTPTTLLSTNTSNFRAMVQQFTGGPSALGFGIGTETGNTSIEIPQPRRVTDQPARGVDGLGQISSSLYVNPWNYDFQVQQHAPPTRQGVYGGGDGSGAVAKGDGGGGFFY